MKFFCLLLAVGFLFAAKAQDLEEKLQAEETLESLPELQDQDETFQGIQDGVLEDPENIPQLRDFTWCSKMGGDCYLLTCPRGTVTIGSCNMMYRCCKRK